MEQAAINPWEWSKAFGFSQAIKTTGTAEMLVCAGQTAIEADGSLPADTDMGAQVAKAFENLGTVLAAAGFGASDVLRVNYFTTDVDELIAVLGHVAGQFFGNHLPASTLVGVTRLAFAELKIEIEAIAGR